MRNSRSFESSLISRADGVEREILQEKATSLARAGERVEDALAELRGLDSSAPGEADRREEVMDGAAEALWYYVVQREACGLRDTARLLHELGVPHEVQLRMGTRKRR
jgi:hypothetical protein